MPRFLNKIKSPEALRKILKSKATLTTVFTNGCFDILHLGHATYIEQAKLQGDILIVALNSDLSVRKLKGPTRPVNTLKNRMGLIAALQGVDYVTWFSEGTPLNLIKKLRPNTLVKGGDYKIKSIVGHKEVTSWGGTVKCLPFLDGHSTSKIIKKMSL